MMVRKFIDLSLTIEPNPSEPVSPKIDYINHVQGADILGESASLTHEDFPDRMGLSQEFVTLTSHSGTHLDAPSHYGPLCEGRNAINIDELPLDWCYSDGVLIKAEKQTEEPVSLEEVQQYLKEINYQLKPMDIVLIYTGADRLWGSMDYFTKFRGISLEATKWILEQGVKIIGVDSFGFDPPFSRMLESFKKTKDVNKLWPAHVYGRQKEYCQIERLTNLTALPSSVGFKISCFPVKIKNAGAGWTRVVAIFEGDS